MNTQTQKHMEKNLVDLLSKLIVESDDDTRFRFQAQNEALSELKCSEPSLGEWIDRCDYSFLMDTLKLSERIFSKEFPDLRLSLDERERFSETLAKHSGICPRCFRKISYDLQWEKCVDRALSENRKAIGDALDRAAGRRGNNTIS